VSEPSTRNRRPGIELSSSPEEQRGGLPVVIELAPRRPRQEWRSRLAALAVLVMVGTTGVGWLWWQHHQPRLPPGITWGNGRIEADEIDIDTKFAGRIAALFVDEGAFVKAGQQLARMDTRDLEASLNKDEAQARQAQKTLEEARANVEQQKAQVRLAQQELERSQFLAPKGWATKELLDQRRQQLDAVNSALAAAIAKVGQTEHALDAAQHQVELDKVNIADNTLVAPRDGRIQYRLANIGEVVPAGGKVFTMLDVASVYMDIYLPTEEAGRVKVGTEGRMLLDAYPNFPIPAKVSFIAAQAQFTPKMVETKTERERLMFLVKVRIDPALLRAHAEAVRTGLPGLAYLRLDSNVAWPAWLQSKAAQ